MPYTHKSLAFVWLIAFGLVALTGSGMVAGSWLLLLVPIALVAPALILRRPRPIGMTTRQPERTGIVSDDRDRPPLDFREVEVYEWENEGGAALMHVGNRRIREP